MQPRGLFFFFFLQERLGFNMLKTPSWQTDQHDRRHAMHWARTEASDRNTGN